MATPPEPEIIPPGQSPRRPRLEDRHLEQLAALLDDLFRIPGTEIRFGLDPLLGLLPGLGDALSGLISMVLVQAAWERGLPRVTIARMMANIAMDAVVGAVPVFGDVFDVAWKANRRNLELLKRAQTRSRTENTLLDGLFLLALLLLLAAVVALPFVLLIWLISEMER